MKKLFLLAILIISLLFFGTILANSDHSHESEIAEGKELVESEVSCDQLTDEQLEAIGEYLMEKMHPGENHTAMHKMMGMEEGTEYHKRFHVDIAKMMYCGEVGRMGMGMPMMPMMQMMMGNGRSMNFGSIGLGSSFWQGILVLTFLVWLIVGILAAIWLWRQITKK